MKFVRLIETSLIFALLFLAAADAQADFIGIQDPISIINQTRPPISETGICESDQFLGIVENGNFRILSPTPSLGSARLTGIPMQAAVSPEFEELDLTAYEGCAIMVCGHDGGGWIYSARIVDRAGPILTAVVLKLFERVETIP